jgi:hypothetical protein
VLFLGHPPGAERRAGTMMRVRERPDRIGA